MSTSQPLAAAPSQSAKPARQSPLPHAPATQRASRLPVTAHTVPHAPQLVAAARVSTSHPFAVTASQLPKPAEHSIPHTPAAHVGAALGGVAHRTPHPPHREGSLRRSTSQPFSASPSQSAKPVAQALPHTPAAQVGVALARIGHALLHAPQCATLVAVAVSQPLAVIPSQSSKPAPQASPQAPAVHAGDALAPAGQGTASQAPQRAGSVCRSMHRMPQRDCPAMQSLPQVNRPVANVGGTSTVTTSPREASVCAPASIGGAVRRHSGRSLGHVVMHAPQCVGSSAAASHPARGSSLQCSQPGSHAPATTQRPATHAAPLDETCGSRVQSLPQAPQFRGLVCRSTHAPLQTLPPSHCSGTMVASDDGTSNPIVDTGGRELSPPHDAATHARAIPAAPFSHDVFMAAMLRHGPRAPQSASVLAQLGTGRRSSRPLIRGPRPWHSDCEGISSMSQRSRHLGDLFHRIVWMLAVPTVGCGSSVTMAVEPDAATDGGVDVVAPVDRFVPIDAGPIDAGPIDTGPIDTGPVDARDCTPRLGGANPGACDEIVLHPCGVPLAAQVDAGSYIAGELCASLCAPTSIGGGAGCRRLAPLADGTEQVACTTCAIGRRTDGLMPIEGARETGPLGDFFARVATLEWASVTAFERLADELEGFGAPGELVSEARRSADDERRHTRAMGAVAERFGAPVRAPVFTEVGKRSLESIALENAAEGCVRETFGALVATWQSRAARDEDIARALSEIAEDETRHAEFSWDLQRWVDGVLDGDARARVHAARAQAAASLWAELDAAVDPSLVAVAGMPDRDTARALFSAMTSALS